MYRGDDIYLLDYWPLDDQNIVGGGVFLAHPIANKTRSSSPVARSASTA